MRLSRRILLVQGIAAMVVSVALGGASFSTLAEPTVALAGDGTPTIDPCQQVSLGNGGRVVTLGEQCQSPTEEGRPKSHTPTVKPSEVPKTEVPSTNTPVPPPPPPPPPSGGTQAGGVRPPDTGTGVGESGGSPWLFVAGGLALAAFGVGSTALGLRRR